MSTGDDRSLTEDDKYLEMLRQIEADIAALPHVDSQKTKEIARKILDMLEESPAEAALAFSLVGVQMALQWPGGEEH